MLYSVGAPAHPAHVSTTSAADDVLAELGCDENAKVFDLRKSMSGRSEGFFLGYQEGGEQHERTQQFVFAHPQFAEVVEEIVHGVAEDGVCLCILGCKQGIHRSQTVGATATSILNNIVENGARLYNAKLWCITDNRTTQRICFDVRTWVEHPWVTMPCARAREEMFGFQAATISPITFHNWSTTIDMALQHGDKVHVAWREAYIV